MRDDARALCYLLLAIFTAPEVRADSQLIFPLQRQHVHSSSVVECPNGDLLTVWFQGSGERTADDVKLMGARRRQGESAWGSVFLMADTPDIPDCNPVLFIDAEQRLWLL